MSLQETSRIQFLVKYIEIFLAITLQSYLIFVIFFTRAKVLENKICTEKRVNYDKPILRQNSVNRDLLGQANNNRV